MNFQWISNVFPMDFQCIFCDIGLTAPQLTNVALDPYPLEAIVFRLLF